MQWIKEHFSSDSDSLDLLLDTSRNLIFTVGALYVLWHFIATMAWPKIYSPSLWLVTLSMGVVIYFSVYFLERNYVIAQIVWQVGLALILVLGYGLYKHPEILLALTFLPLMAVVTIGRAGTVFVEALVIGVVIAIQQSTFLLPLSAGYSTGIVLGSVFTSFFGWGLSHNMLSALSSANYHYYQARDLLEETRRHRGEISKILKERNHANYQLERLNQMLNNARTKAEEARDDRDRFVLAVSHELRSPLNFILGFSDLMSNSPETYADLKNWPPGLYDDVQEIYRSSHHLMDLINDILDLGQISAQQMTIYREKTAIQRLVEEVQKMVEPAFTQKGLWLKISFSPNLPKIFVDTTRIRQVILNLVLNGLRFTNQGGVVIAVEEQPESLLVKIRDTGTGIAAEEIDKVFEAFRQVGQDSWRRRDGSGLGLAISKQFVELHGGKMWLESQLGKGTTFFFSLPLIDANKTLEPIFENQDWRKRARVVSEDQKPLALLLTSDSLTSRLLYQSLDTFDIVPVNQIDELPKIIEKLYPQAVFVDKSVPFDRIRLRDLPYDLPVIGISLPGIGGGFESLPENLNDYLVKPVKREVLISAVQRLGEGIFRILVVDDDPAMVRFLTQALKAGDSIEEFPAEYEFLSANTGQDALSQLQEQPIDAILLDLDLPDINGWDILLEIRNIEKAAKTPVIIISAMDFSQTLYTNGRQVIDVKMRRPFSKHEMSALLNAILDNVKPIYPRSTDSSAQAQREDPAV